jgi:outer membrane receptor protein involved in Fe transport
VDFERGRVKSRRTLDLTFSQRVHRAAGAELSFRLSLLNVTNARWANNFGNPFSGTHFGPGRTVQVGLRAGF